MECANNSVDSGSFNRLAYFALKEAMAASSKIACGNNDDEEEEEEEEQVMVVVPVVVVDGIIRAVIDFRKMKKTIL